MEKKEAIERIRSLEQSCKNIHGLKINFTDSINVLLDFHKTAGVAFFYIKPPEYKTDFYKINSI